MELREAFGRIKIIPVCVFDNVESALKTTEILLEKNVDVIEVTLRTESALDCIASIKKEFPASVIGAGSIFDKDGMMHAADCGAVFGVSPCFNEELSEYAIKLRLPFIPGIATPTELSKAVRYSSIIKLFPARDLGGPDYINSITAPFRKFEFDLIPTGGIDNKNYREYLACEKVLACGLTYPVSENLIRGKDYASIKKRIEEIYGEFL